MDSNATRDLKLENLFNMFHLFASAMPPDHIRILGIELDLACNGGSCGEIY